MYYRGSLRGKSGIPFWYDYWLLSKGRKGMVHINGKILEHKWCDEETKGKKSQNNVFVHN